MRTAWELRELIRPLPVRRTPRRTALISRHFDPALVEWVWQSRYCLTSQLQRRFPEWLPSHRTAQRHVARLIDGRLLAQASCRSTGPHFPMIVYATGRGLRLVRETYARLGKNWQGPLTEEGKAKGLALDSLLHEVLTSEIDLAVYRTIDTRDDLLFLHRERRYFRSERKLTYQEQGRTRRVIPDAGYLAGVESPTGRTLLPLMLLELENGTHSVRKLRQKLQRYQRWAESSAADDLQRLYAPYGVENKASWRLLFVCHDKHGTVADERRLLDLLVQSLELPPAVRDRIWLTTAERLKRHAHDPAPLDAPLWTRAKDARSWLPAFRRLQQGSGQHRCTHQRAFVAERLPTVRRHALFPRSESRRRLE